MSSLKTPYRLILVREISDMRKARLLRVSCRESLCIFCAHRLFGRSRLGQTADVLSSAAAQRALHTTRRPLQSTYTTPAATTNEEANTNHASRRSLDSYSELTPTEQREKERRIQLRREQEQHLESEREQKQQSRETPCRKIRYLVTQREPQARVNDPELREREAKDHGKISQRGRSGGEQNLRANGNGNGRVEERRAAAIQEKTFRFRNVSLNTRPKDRLPLPTFGSNATSSDTARGTAVAWGAAVGERKPLRTDDEAVEHRDDTLAGTHASVNSESVNARGKPKQDPQPGDYDTAVASERWHRNNESSTSESQTLQPVRRPNSITSRPSVGSDPSNASFKASSVDSDEHLASRPQSKREPFAEWQHIRPKQPDSTTASLPGKTNEEVRSDSSKAEKPNPFGDLDTIERNFNIHRAGRSGQNSQSMQPPGSALLENRELSTDNTFRPFGIDPSQIVCARCQERGHRANECQGPKKKTCHRCGQVGHFAFECPDGQSQGSRGRRDSTGHGSNVFGGSQMQTETVRVSQLEFREHSSDSRQIDVDEDTAPRRRGRFSRWENSEDTEEPGLAAMQHPQSKPRRQTRRNIEDEADVAEIDVGFQKARAARKAARKAEKDKKTIQAKYGRLDADGMSINLPEFVSVSNLAQTLGVGYDAFVSHLERLGYDDVFPGKILNAETSGMIAMEYNFEPIFESAAGKREDEEHDLKAQAQVDDQSLLPTRPPVVTIMGHVDHGKTTILDYLRKSSVAIGEAGGITQHIGAFSVPLSSSGKTITFLDTPGHAAFLAMRRRGANVTDIVILVVAADDSVKPQTLEALRHARSANVPIIVAVNKIDKPEANLVRVKQDLAQNSIEIEDFGGDTQVIAVSGKTGEGMDEFEEAVVTLSEILDHRADTQGPVEGWILEATTKKAGRVATILVRRGMLRAGAILVAGTTWTRVRSLRNEAGKAVTEVGPGIPVEVDGWRDQPDAGDEVLQATSEQKATSVVEYRVVKEEREKTAKDMEAINEARKIEQDRRAKEKVADSRRAEDEGEATPTQAESSPETEPKSGQGVVNFIVKADVSGSVEAVTDYVLSVSTPLVAPRIISSQVGGVHESDIERAAVAKAHVIAFNLPSDEPMKASAEAKGVQILEHNIIYRVVEEVRSIMEQTLPPVVTQRVLGEAEISTVFDIGLGGKKTMKIAGCKVRNGVIGRGSRVRVLRGTQKIYDGTVGSLKNVKKDVDEMRKGTECGMGFNEWQGFEAGDQIQTYEEISERRKLPV